LFDVWITDNDHDVGGTSEFIDEGSELLVLDHHALELVIGLDATEFELFYDITYLFKPVHILVPSRIVMRYHQES